MEETELRDAVEVAVKLLGGIPYFPKDDDYAKAAIMAGISQFADSPEGVRWMAAQAIAHMRKWTGVPELRGIYCAGGFQPADGRHEACLIPSLNRSSLPAYYDPAPKLLPEPPMTAEEKSEMEAFIKDLEAKWAANRAERALKPVFKNRIQPTPAWLKNIDG
jgi:hypothetical protein